jgi:hypothetical protein
MMAITAVLVLTLAATAQPIPGYNPAQIGRSPAQLGPNIALVGNSPARIGTNVAQLGYNPALLGSTASYTTRVVGYPRRPFIFGETIAAPINVGAITVAPTMSIQWKGNPTQVLQLQQDVLALLENPFMQSRLGLTADQQAYLPGLANWSNEQTANIRALEATNPIGAAQAYRNYESLFQNRFSGFLTPQQWSIWEQMTQPPSSPSP